MEINVHMPGGAMGASDDDAPFESFLRIISVAACKDRKNEWADKYSTNFENDVFMLHPYCWCEKETCPWCSVDPMDKIMLQQNPEGQSAPNFHYKPTDFKVWWYKYIGRGMDQNRPLKAEEFTELARRCFESLGLTEADRVQLAKEIKEHGEASVALFKHMLSTIQLPHSQE